MGGREEPGRERVREKPYRDTVDTYPVSRRDLLRGLGTIAHTGRKAGIGAAIYMTGKAAVDSHVHNGLRFGKPSAQCASAYPPAIEAAAADDLDIHLVNLRSDRDDNAFDVDAAVDDVEYRLTDLDIEAEAHAHDVDVPDTVYEAVAATTVKRAKVSGTLDTVERYLDRRTPVTDAVDDDDVVMYIGDFDCDFFVYRGTAHRGNVCSVANIYNDTYTTNQIAHNIGHTLGLPHTETEEQMTWSPVHELDSHLTVAPFGWESQHNWRKSQQYYSEHDGC